MTTVFIGGPRHGLELEGAKWHYTTKYIEVPTVVCGRLEHAIYEFVDSIGSTRYYECKEPILPKT